MKFSKALNAFAALAFSPTFSIDPTVVGEFDKRFVAYFKPELMNGRAIDREDLCDRNYIFVDPLARVERANALKIANLPGLFPGQVETIPMYFMDHGTVRVISESRIGRKLANFFDAPKNGPTKEALRTLIRSSRNSSNTYRT